MKKATESKGIKSFERFALELPKENILGLDAMTSVRGRDGGEPIIPPPPPGKP